METKSNATSKRPRSRLLWLGGLAVAVVVALTAASGAGAADEGRSWGGRPGPGEMTHCIGIARVAMEVDDTLTELTGDGTLTQAQADAVRDRLRQRADEAGGPCAARLALIEDVSNLLGLSPSEIRERFVAGASLAEIADEQGVARDDLVALFQDAVGVRLDEAVASGRITAEERDALEVLAFSRIEKLIDHHLGDGFGPGERTDPAASPAAVGVAA